MVGAIYKFGRRAVTCSSLLHLIVAAKNVCLWFEVVARVTRRILFRVGVLRHSRDVNLLFPSGKIVICCVLHVGVLQHHPNTIVCDASFCTRLWWGGRFCGKLFLPRFPSENSLLFELRKLFSPR